VTRRVLVSWSSGKDSSWMLHQLQQQPGVELVGLLTTFNESADRVAMHAVRRVLAEAQAAAADLPLWPVMLPSPCSNEVYQATMTKVMERARSEGVTHVAFGDLYLTDIRAYRERQMQGTGVAPLFPIWGAPEPAPVEATAPLHPCERAAGDADAGGDAPASHPAPGTMDPHDAKPGGPGTFTPALARDMLDAGLRAVLTAVDPKQLDPSFVGRAFDAALLADLPPAARTASSTRSAGTARCSASRSPCRWPSVSSAEVSGSPISSRRVRDPAHTASARRPLCVD
jgi:diphthamide synthase (EF-2-diphthine--ammonia ligase)